MNNYGQTTEQTKKENISKRAYDEDGKLKVNMAN